MIPTCLCQFDKFSCFGCCGKDFTSKNAIRRQIKKNTRDLKKIKDLEKFRDREDANLLSWSGVCFNMILKDGRVLCPLHPAQTGGKELRKGHCDMDYLCRAAMNYKTWNDEKKQRFLEFLKKKNHNWLTYSLKMDDDSYLEEFEREERELEEKQ